MRTEEIKHTHDLKVVDSIVQKIVRYSKPAHILLFGSRARNEQKDDSVIDICILFDKLPKRNLEILQDLYQELYTIDTGPVDLVVYDDAVFRIRAGQPNSFEAHILHEGITLYG